MSGVRRSATSRLEEGEATWLAWSSATDEAEEQARIRDTDLETVELVTSTERRGSDSDGDIADHVPFVVRGAPPGRGTGERLSDYSSLGSSSANETSSDHHKVDGHGHELSPYRPWLLEPANGDLEDDFEPVGDLPSLPKLDFKPIMLRSWVLIVIAVSYLTIIAGLGVLYQFENASRLFHVRATASRFTIRYLPPLIGSLSTILFQAIVQNFARIQPYIIMAAPIGANEKCATAKETLLAQYFPLLAIAQVWKNRHVLLLAMTLINLFLNPFITPFKSTLILKKVSEHDPNLWTISISGLAAKYLIFNFSILFLLVVGILIFLWNRRTGLKWDPVSLADQMMLLQGSDILKDFSGLEYRTNSPREQFTSTKTRFKVLESRRYRLGYWRHRPTDRYWHGIRKWPGPERDAGNRYGSDWRAPRLKDSRPKALAWWKSQCSEVLQNPNKCYRFVYTWISDPFAVAFYIVVVGSAALGIWVIASGQLKTGFTFPSTDFPRTNLILRFLPTFLIGLLNTYWYQMDLWYRQLQPYMGLRQPSPAKENLLLRYPCDLPVVITLRALGAKHWRLALTSFMPLMQRVLQILVGSLLTVDKTSSRNYFNISISPTPFKAAFSILCGYIVLIPVIWPGLDRRLPIVPQCIADYIVLFYDSTLVRKDAFLPRRLNEERWHMKYKLCLEERLYGFGIYPGRYGALHLGIDDVYGYHEEEKGLRFVLPLKPPVRTHKLWLKKLVVWAAQKLHIKRQPTLHDDKLDSLHRLQTRPRRAGEERAPADGEDVGAGGARVS